MKTEEVARLRTLIQRARKEFENGFAALSEVEQLIAVSRSTDRTKNLLGSQLEDPTLLFRRPIVDTASMTVTWAGSTVLLRSRLLMSLMVVFSQHPNQFIPVERLRRDVWEGEVRSDETVRSTIRRLKEHLSEAGMKELATCIQSAGLRYGLVGLQYH